MTRIALDAMGGDLAPQALAADCAQGREGHRQVGTISRPL